MINISKAFIFAMLILLILSNSLFADCPHCYTAAEVKVIFKDGEVMNVIIPIFGRDFEENESKIKKGIDLKTLFVRDLTSITYVDSFRFIPKIGRLAIREEIKTLPMEKINQIIFLSWDKMTGAMRFPNLPKETVDRLKSKKILGDITITDGVSDIIYINQDPGISEKEFNLFFRYAPDRQFDKYWKIRKKIRAELGSIKEETKEVDLLENAKNFIIELRDSLQKEIETLSISCSNEGIRNYLNFVSNQRETHIKFLNSIIVYLESGDIEIIKSFANNDIDDEKTKQHMNKIIESYINDIEKSSKRTLFQKKKGIKDDIKIRAEITQKSIASLNEYFSWKNYALFDKALEKTDFIAIEYSWD